MSFKRLKGGKMKDLLNIDFNLYKSFYFVAKEGSFSRAAECLYVTQPLISNNVKTLEELLNAKLFERTTKRVLLTAVGQHLYERIENCYNLLIDIERNVKMLQDSTFGEIKVGVTNDIGVYYVSFFIKDFLKKYPQVKFVVLDKEKTNLVESLKNRHLDVVFILDPSETVVKGLEFCLLQRTTGCFVGPASKVQNKIYSVSDFSGKNFALPSFKSKSRQYLDAMFYQKNVKINVVLETNSTNIGLNLMNTNIDVAYFNKLYINTVLKDCNLKLYQTNIDFPPINIYIAYHQKYNTYASENFIKFIKEKAVDL